MSSWYHALVPGGTTVLVIAGWDLVSLCSVE